MGNPKTSERLAGILKLQPEVNVCWVGGKGGLQGKQRENEKKGERQTHAETETEREECGRKMARKKLAL